MNCLMLETLETELSVLWSSAGALFSKLKDPVGISPSRKAMVLAHISKENRPV